MEEKFEDRLKKAAGLIGGQAELARRTGISSRSINAYTLGESDPSRERIVAMARASGVSVGWLAADEGPMQPGQNNINHMEDPFITDIKLWLNEMSNDDPDWRAWFKMELLRNFADFKEWREKKRHTDQIQDTGTDSH